MKSGVGMFGKIVLLACALSVSFPIAMAQEASQADSQAVLKVESQFHRAFLAADIKALDRLLTSEFVWMHGDGMVWTKPQLIEKFRSGKLAYKRDDTDSVKVIMYGAAAVVVGHDNRQYSSGEAIDFNYTTTYVKQDSAWRVAVFHSTHCPCAKPQPSLK